MSFKEKVLSMTGKEIVMAMVNGLQKEWVYVDMNTFGYQTKKGICYGCAATNAICEITGKIPDLSTSNYHRLISVDDNYVFVARFEKAINRLRFGDIGDYNYWAREMGIAELPQSDLPPLNNQNYKENLQAYIDYANTL